MKKAEGRADFASMISSSVFDMLDLRCLLDIQVQVPSDSWCLSLNYKRKDQIRNGSFRVIGEVVDLDELAEGAGQELSNGTKVKYLATGNVKLKLTHLVCSSLLFILFSNFLSRQIHLI